MAKWQGTGLIWQRRYFFLGVGDRSDMHATHATIVCISLGAGTSFQLRTEDGHGLKSYRAAIIAPGVRHAKVCDKAGVIILLYLTPETDESYRIRDKYLPTGGIAEVPQAVLDALIPQLGEYGLDRYKETHNMNNRQAKALCEEMDCARGDALCRKIIAALGVTPSTDLSEELDPRVKTAIEVMDEKVRDRAAADELKVEEIRREVDARLAPAKKPCGLGEVFKDSVDVTMGHYKVGLRLREALTEINPDTVLRRLAVKFGLFDGAALSHVFYDWLGIRPNEIKKQSYFRRCQ